MPHVVGIRFQDDLNGPAAVRIDYNRAFEVQSALLHRLPDNAEDIIAQGMAVLDLHLTQFLRREQRLIAGMQRKGIHGDKGQGGGGGTLQAEHIPVTAGEGESADIKWNFTKFLIDRNGNVVERFEPTADMDVVEEKIREIL